MKASNKHDVTHKNVKCDGCSLKPIVGIRYKCSVCPEFNYCEICEATKEHAHTFLKVKTNEVIAVNKKL